MSGMIEHRADAINFWEQPTIGGVDVQQARYCVMRKKEGAA
ncbi:MAG: hypothetical protein ACREQO_12475 [Candidatus Binatia bacterium]